LAYLLLEKEKIMLKCQTGDWSSRNPGYVWWNENQIEHLGPMSDPDWPTTGHVEWKKEAEERCRHLESLGIVPTFATYVYYYDWFKYVTDPSTERWWWYFVNGWAANFYVDKDLNPVFVKEYFIKDGDWVIEFSAALWKDGKWHFFRDTAKCSDVVYHRMHQLGFFFGTKALEHITHGGKFQNLLPNDQPGGNYHAWYFGSVKLPDEPCPLAAIENLSDLPTWAQLKETL
jgi:hypothetical protein